MSNTRNRVLVGAVTLAVKGSGLKVTGSGSEMTITDPRDPEEGSVVIDYKCQYLAWERPKHDYWHFGDLTDDQAQGSVKVV